MTKLSKITEEFDLDENYSILMEQYSDERLIYKKDKKLKHFHLIAIYTKDGKWKTVDVINIKDFKQNDDLNFWKLIEQYPGIKNNIFKPMLFSHEVTIEKQFKCFNRRIKISILRTLNQIKHIKL